MTPLDNRPRIAAAASVLAPLVIAALLLSVGLGEFGLWEPHETARLQAGKAAGPGMPSIGDALARLGAGWDGHEESGARLPSAALALLAVAVLGLAALSLAGRRVAFLAAITFVGAPLFLLHGRQVTGAAPLLLGETLAFAGLALLAFGDGRRAIAAGAIAALVGLFVATWCGGTLMGVAVPAATIFVALAGAGDASPSAARRRAMLIATVALSAAGAAAFAFAVARGWDAPLLTAGLAAKPASIDCAATVGQLAYGWFPWSALLPLLFLPTDDAAEEDPRRRAIRILAVAGIAIGATAQIFFRSRHGSAPLFLVVPVALGAALVLEDLERTGSRRRFAAVVVLAAVGVMLRDFAQEPAAILSGYGFALKAPEPFKPAVHAAIAAAPFVLLVAAAGFLRGADTGLRGARVRLLATVAAAAFGGYVALNMVPSLSVHFSPKHVLESYDRFAKKGEPLAVYGSSTPVPGAEVLSRADELLAWLSRPARVFALVPPQELPRLDSEYRAARGEHVFVLDASSSRLLLATSLPAAKERNVNPIAEHVRSEPFPTAPRNVREVDFEGKLRLLGWEVASKAGKDALQQGADFTLTTYWRCTAAIPQSYSFFVHIDGAGPRINGDHTPVGGAYPTQYWKEGDYIRDVFKGQIPGYQKKGSYTIRMGLFHGDTRLKVIGDPTAAESSVPLGKIRLE
ncbi:MAG: hypothetical protein M0R80_09495 [Proteobacteria bacterium]|jgi:hypothetical protein|nr:hypothetical protein [Pseudomonadota bacterium]